ncbi:hypothetical protein [Nitrosomonas ureae]|uniref:Uncharacterized protein n=1 Tax=Nitrosomonas ureae TaxID=44577 RepID=A0A0S3AJD0_9PROT|nr:hypothetical protein [Nitrosomonas ureae]ALQ51247.1 hypothetical protein ATY38_08455 [Nitrosomonas ureae]SDU22233.1 hypothetical protein SAMN05216406_13618 [Nitrosomonas ureae]SEP91587.1 hypothetical protein SAMN05421510_101016 [Nitrosomonas ureae]
MLNSSILDIAIGMVFLFVLISLLCSTINEMIAQFLCMRAKNLEAGLANLLQSGAGNKLVSDLYNHPLINGLSKAGHKPSYIPAKNFTLALMDIMSGSMGKIPTDNKSLIEAIERQGQFARTEAGKSIILLLHEAGDNVEKARRNLEGWYNDAMDRVGGWYKQKTQIIIFVTSLIICAVLNIDAIKISQTLWTDIALRQALVEAASSSDIARLMPQESTEQEPTVVDDVVVHPSEQTAIKAATEDRVQSAKNTGALIEQIKALHLPIGWKEKIDGEDVWVYREFDLMGWIVKIMGILITTFAASLGAPFWFQLLNKVVDLRAAGKQPAKSGRS